MNKYTGEIKAEERFKKLQMEIIAVFAAMIIIVTIFLVGVILEHSNSTIQEQASSLMATNSRQIQLNINSYLEKVETTAALIFANEEYYQYDASTTVLDEYAVLKTEESILDRIVDLGVMENFSDFAIVYANDHTIGWVSHTTDDMFSDGGMYQTFSDCINRERRNDGWKFCLNGNTERAYYVKRLNPNAILFVSFYTKELEHIFKDPEEFRKTTFHLINEDGMILYSSEKAENGAPLSEEIANAAGQRTAAIAGQDYLVSSAVCENGWKIICLTPTAELLRENRNLKKFVSIFAAALAAVFILIGLLLIRQISRPMDGMMIDLAQEAVLDKLSGLLNKVAFEDEVTHKMECYTPGRYFVFVMLDADNFKQINDHLGHSYGDQVITRIARLLQLHLSDQTLIGRLGGDEFAFFAEYTDFNTAEITRDITHKMDEIFTAFTEEFCKERTTCEFSLSAGICIIPDAESIDFQKTYRQADKALYRSKENGKSQYTLYQEDMEHDRSI